MLNPAKFIGKRVTRTFSSNKWDFLDQQKWDGVKLLIKSKVHYPGPPNPMNGFLGYSGLWLFYNGNEAAIVDAPFVWQERKKICSTIRSYLDERSLHLKFITCSHLHRDHAEGLTALLEYFPEATFIFPNSWRHNWKEFPKNIDPPGFEQMFHRQYSLGYDVDWIDDLAGERIQFFRAPYHSKTDQVVSFRGVGLLPDWHLPTNPTEKCKLVKAPKHEIKKTIKIMEGSGINASLSAHGKRDARHDFQFRISMAKQKFHV